MIGSHSGSLHTLFPFSLFPCWFCKKTHFYWFCFQIEWFMHQKEKKYHLMSTDFNDPLFYEQWYIVSNPRLSYNIHSTIVTTAILYHWPFFDGCLREFITFWWYFESFLLKRTADCALYMAALAMNGASVISMFFQQMTVKRPTCQFPSAI